MGKLLKTCSEFAADLLERLGHRLRRRKPRLYVHYAVAQSLWCIATQTERDGTKTPIMQLIFSADFNHDDPKQDLVIVNAYPKGMRQQKVAAFEKFNVPPGRIVTKQVAVWVLPLLAEQGKDWKGRFILVDQFMRKHKTERVVFRWVGCSPSSKNPA